MFLGSRGVANFELVLNAREGGHHSGNWGGLLRNPGTVLANAIASLVDGCGRILVQCCMLDGAFKTDAFGRVVRRKPQRYRGIARICNDTAGTKARF